MTCGLSLMDTGACNPWTLRKTLQNPCQPYGKWPGCWDQDVTVGWFELGSTLATRRLPTEGNPYFGAQDTKRL